MRKLGKTGLQFNMFHLGAMPPVLALILLLSFISGCSSTGAKTEPDTAKPSASAIVAPDAQQNQTPSPETAAQKTPQSDELDAKYDQILKKIMAKQKAEEEAKDAKPEAYRLRKGDSVEVSVLDELEMTRNVSVIPDGSITYLLVGEIPAEGKTVAELRMEIQNKLSGFFVNPRVSVILSKISKQEEEKRTISIVGAVQSPGEIQITDKDRVIDVIAKAGGLLYINDWMGGRTVANLKASYISRKGVKLDVDFDKLLRIGDMNFNVPVENGDFIYIADAESSSIFILGEVYNPQLIPYNRDISLVEALSRSGGFTHKAEKSRVIVLRDSGLGNEFVYVDVESLLYGDKEEQNMILKAGDIVYVPEQGLSEWSRYAEYLMVFGSLLLQGYEIRDQVRFPRLNRRDEYFH